MIPKPEDPSIFSIFEDEARKPNHIEQDGDNYINGMVLRF
jgi:hypothetical protein